MRDLYKKVKPYLHNSLWLLSDRVLALVIGFLVTAVVARYLGPQDFGILSYALSFSALFAAAGHMGLGGLVVREIVSKPEQRGETLGTAITLKFLGMAAGYVALLLIAATTEGIGSVEFAMVSLVGAALLFQPAQVVNFWFEAFVQARYAVAARVTAILAVSAFRLLLVFSGASLLYFATANLFQALLTALLLLWIFYARANLKLSQWRFSWERAKELLKQGWKIYLGSIFAVVYLKVDQVMLRWLIDAEAVGVYAVAAQFSEAWYFVPAAIVSSFFPRLIKLHEKDQQIFNFRLKQLIHVLFMLALLVAVFMVLVSEWLVVFFFGEAYLASTTILMIHIWAALFIFMRAALSKWIIIENLLMFSLLTQGLGALCNVLLNLVMIPAWGGMGAAWATLVSYAVASFLALAFSRKTWPVFWMMFTAFFSPITFAYAGINRLRSP